MTARLRLITRIALTAALIYVLSLAAMWLPNVNPIFFVVFAAGYMWGGSAGFIAGAIGMGLWSGLNPYGPALLPIMLAQMVGAGASGPIGALYNRIEPILTHWLARGLLLVVSALICTIAFQVPVSVADAWMFQPFWERLVTGLAWGLPILISNAIIFPLLFRVVRFLYERERARQ